MSEKNCTNCNYAIWETDAKGEKLFLNFARCNFPEIQYPNSYIDSTGNLPIRFMVSRFTKADCLFWGSNQ